MALELKRYKSSGVTPFKNTLFSISFGILILLPITLIYSLLITINPVIYLNTIIIIGFSYSIAQICYILCIKFKIRDKPKALIIVSILVLFASYFQWVFYIYMITLEDINLLHDFIYIIDIIIDPIYVLDTINEINTIGIWEIDSKTYTGIELWIIWFLELFLTFLISLKIFSNYKFPPFSETDNQWYTKNIIFVDFEFINYKKTFLDEFYKDPFKKICSLEKGNGVKQSNIYIYSTKNQTSFLISIENSTLNNKGRKKNDVVLAPSILNKIHFIQISKKFKMK